MRLALVPILLLVLNLLPITTVGWITSYRKYIGNSQSICLNNLNDDMFEEKNYVADYIQPINQQIDPDIDSKVKLKEELVSPFRNLRRYVYLGMGSGGGLGLFFAVPQLYLALQSNIGVSDTAFNLAVDLGGVIVAAILWDKESKDSEKTISRFREKELRQSNRLSTPEIQERERIISLLPVEIQISETNASATRIVKFADLQEKGKQNIVIIAGNKDFVKDAIITARIEGESLFARESTYVVPVVMTNEELEKEERGFGTTRSILNAPYIVKAAQIDIWRRCLQPEIETAIKTQADKPSGNIYLCLKQNGKVIRRGIGLPPWKDVVAEINKKSQPQ